jgi:hypothetical protein
MYLDVMLLKRWKMEEKLIRVQTQRMQILNRQTCLRKDQRTKKLWLKSKQDSRTLSKTQLHPPGAKRNIQQSQMILAPPKVKAIKNMILTTISSLKNQKAATLRALETLQTILMIKKSERTRRNILLYLFKMTRMCSLKSMGKEMVILIEQTYSFDNTS